MASGDRSFAFTEEHLDDLSETIGTVHEAREMDQGYWEMIPTEILEKILLDVPTYQIPFNGTFVCKRWTSIILKPQFWVHKLKLNGISIDEKIWSVLNEFENKILSCLYYASLYQEHRTQQTPLSNLVLNIPIDEEVEPEKNWVILDDFDSMLLATGVLICRSHWSQWYIFLYLKNENIKALPLLLKLLAAREVPVAVRDDYTFWNFTPRIDYLNILKGSGDEAKSLDQFRGCLPALEGLPTMGDVILSIGVDDQNFAIDPGFSRIEEYPYPVLHLKAGTNFSNLPNIPVPPESYILVSGLEESHILWMTDVTRKLSNNGHTLVFFNYQLDLKSSESLLNKMAKAGLDSYGILCSSRTLSSESETILNELACRLFSHWFSGFQLCDNDNDLICHLDKEGISCLLGIDDVDYY